MATSKNRQEHNLRVRLDELRQRAAWATGETRMRLLEEIERVSKQLDVMKERKK